MAPGGNIISTRFDARYHQKEFRAVTMEGMENATGLGLHRTFMNVMGTDALQESEYLFGGLPNVPRHDSERKPLASVSYPKGPPVYYVQEMYGYKYRYTKRAARYDRSGTITKVVSSMGEAAADTIEWVAVHPLNAALTLSGGWDQVPLASAAHETLDGRTFSNILPPAGANTAFLQAIYTFAKRGIVNDMGRVVQVPIGSIQVSPERVPSLQMLLEGSVLAGQDNPAIKNPYSDVLKPSQIIGNWRLMGTYDVHVLFKGHRLNMFVAMQPTTRTWNEDDPQAINHSIEFELIVGWTDGRRYAMMSGQGG